MSVPTPETQRLPPVPPLTRDQILITVGIMSALAVSALDATVVGTAMPTIIGQLGGLSEYGWVFSAYLLTSTTTVPLYSKLADMVGRKPIFLFGLIVFVVASALCGFSTSMGQLILFRAIQGIGAGAVQPMCFTIAGDIFEPRQRVKVQGLFGAVWGMSAVVGPALGGLITTTVGWPWVFELNIPVGVLAGVIVSLVLRESFERRPHRLDIAGAVWLSLSILLLLFAVSQGGETFGWTSPITLGLIGTSVLLLALFIRTERRAPEPLVDLSVFRDPLIGPGLLIGVLLGVSMFGLQTYVPPMIQGVHGGTPIDAGTAVAAMTLGWPVGATLGGRLWLRIGARPLVLVGSGLVFLGTLLVTQIDRFPELWFAMFGVGIMGLGMGFASSTLMVVIQGSVAWDRRGVVTGLVQFSRTIGGAVGVGVMGGILTAFVGTASSAILDPLAHASIPPDQLASARAGLAGGLGIVYVIVAACAGLALLVAVRSMPGVSLGEGGRIDVRAAARARAQEEGSPLASGQASPGATR